MNYLAIVLAAAASFVFGGIWYGFFSNPWLAALGKSEAELKSGGRTMPFLFGLTIVAELLMALVLAGLIGHLGPGQVTLYNGFISGAFVWLGFVITTLMVNHGYQSARWSLTAIDGGHWLGVLLLQGAIIGWMGTG
jgi:hypothetical protein